jgi:hypothetical protein
MFAQELHKPLRRQTLVVVIFVPNQMVAQQIDKPLRRQRLVVVIAHDGKKFCDRNEPSLANILETFPTNH